MPIYEYHCLDCQEIFEELWGSFKEAEELEGKYLLEAKCPKCNSVNKAKKMSAPMINFAGEGWTNKVISGVEGRRDSTGSIKDHSDQIKEKAKNMKTKDLYGDLSGI